MHDDTVYTSSAAAAEIAIGADDLIELDAGELRRREIEAVAQNMTAACVPQVVEALSDSDWRVRRAAAAALACDEEAEVAEVLCSLLESEDPGERNAAIKALIKRGADSVPALLGALGSDDADARNFACVALGRIGDTRAVGGLTTISLEDTDSNVRYVAIEALGHIGDERAVDSLITQLDGDPWLASISAEALGSIGGLRALEALVGKLADDPVGLVAADALGNIGDPRALLPLSHAAAKFTPLVGVPAVCSMGDTVASANSTDAAVAVVELLRGTAQEIATENTIASLNRALREGGDATESALHAAVWLGMPELAESVCVAANEPEYAHLAVDYLVQDLDAVREQLRAASESSNPSMRTVAAMAIERAGNEDDLEIIIKLVNDDNQSVSIAAARALALIGDPSSAQELMDSLESGIDEIAFTAADALGKIGLEPVLPRLVELAESGNPVVRRAVARAFSAAMTDGAEEGIAQCLLTLARDPNPRVRAEITVALGSATSNETISALLVLSLDEDRDVRLSAIRTLSRRSEPAAHRALRGATADESRSIRAAAARGLFSRLAEEDIELALTLLHDPDPGTVIATATGLVQSGRSEAIQAVVRLSDHESDDVRAAVLRAMSDADPEITRELAAVVLSRNEPAWNVRLAAAEALVGCDESTGARAIVEQTLADIEPMIREAAVASVPDAFGDSAVEVLIGLLEDPLLQDEARHALEAMGSKASPALSTALGALEGNARRLGTFALGTMQTNESCFALEKLLASDDPEDTWNAAMAIVTCGCCPDMRILEQQGDETVVTVLRATEGRCRCDRA